MIRIKKDKNGAPTDYLDYITSKKYRKNDFDKGHHSKQDGQTIFKRIKKKKKEFKSLKTKLLNDQGYICCYCNERVEFTGSSVEHIKPISSNKSLLAEYSNLLIACNGGRNIGAKSQDSMEEYPLYCDAHKGNKELPFSPLDSECESSFNYSYIDGSVSATTLNAQSVINILNLDCSILREKRLAAYEILFDDEDDFISEQELEKIWDSLWKRNAENKYESFFFQILWVIYEII